MNKKKINTVNKIAKIALIVLVSYIVLLVLSNLFSDTFKAIGLFVAEFIAMVYQIVVVGLIIFGLYKFTTLINRGSGSNEDQCPRCDSENLKKVKPSSWSKYKFASIAMFSGAGTQPKTLIVCRDCGFSWNEL